MKVDRLIVRNFTSLADVDLIDLPNLVVFIGKNSSGKSNLIDALALFFAEFGTEIHRELGGLDDYHHLFPHHDAEASEVPQIEVMVTLSANDWATLLSVDLPTATAFEQTQLYLEKKLLNNNGSLQWKTETVGAESFEIVVDGLVESSDQLIEPYIPDDDLMNTVEVDIETPLFLERLAHLLVSSFEVIHTTESPRSWTNRFLERPTILDAEFVNNLWELSQSTGNRRQPWTRTIQRYSQIAPNLQRPAGVASTVQMEEGSLTVPIGMTGEGSQAVLRLVEQLERGSSIIAIEEPETHLHPALIRQVGQLLREATENGKQIFICTHSPFLVERTSLQNFYIVKNQQSRTQISSVNDIRGLRDLLFDIGVRPSDILFSDAILLVEGLSDEIFFNLISNKLRVPLADRHVKIIPAHGSSRGRRKIEFWAEVGRDSGLPLYLILDSSAEEEAEIAMENGHVTAERCLILGRGDLEDYYPWDLLDQVLRDNFNVEVDEPIPVGERVEQLRKHLSRKAPKNAWKPLVAEEVAKKMTQVDAEREAAEIADFLRKIHRDLGLVRE